jgi:cytochrome c553
LIKTDFNSNYIINILVIFGTAIQQIKPNSGRNKDFSMVAFNLKWKKIGLTALTLLLFFSSKANTGTDSLKSPSNIVKQLTAEDIRMGERLFFGLVSTGENNVSCASCHYTKYIDTLNWNPSAFEISRLYISKNAKDLADILQNPTGKKMNEVHVGITLSDKQIEQIKGFMDKYQASGAPERKPHAGNLILFIISVVIALGLTIDLIFLRLIRSRLLAVALLLLVFFYQVDVIAREGIAIGRSENYAPSQPIKFSHYVHATGNKIDCRYCHSTVEYSKAAGIPSVNVCLNCHTLVREGTHSGQFEISKIHYANDNHVPVQWIKVHNLPDHVFFSHAQHVSAGKVQCVECHGDVAGMNVIRQVKDLSMGFCIKCHREKEVQFFDNAFYKKYEDLHKAFKDGKIKRVTVEMIGGTECMKCHY